CCQWARRCERYRPQAEKIAEQSARYPAKMTKLPTLMRMTKTSAKSGHVDVPELIAKLTTKLTLTAARSTTLAIVIKTSLRILGNIMLDLVAGRSVPSLIVC